LVAASDNRPVAQERTGWRDEQISKRHRAWGYDCPALDIDFLMLEYDRGKVAALVEYKHERAAPIRRGHPSMRAMADLGDRAGVPVFVVRYAGDFSWWSPHPLNDLAREITLGGERVSEEEWIRILYRCRGRDLPEDWARAN